jgi:hypothetical protein
MREEPVISGAVLKGALVLLVAGGLGVGAYALAGGGIDVDLPDLPEIDTTTESVTNLEETTLEATTIGDEPVPQPSPQDDLNKLSKCIEAAGSDTDRIFACLDKY